MQYLTAKIVSKRQTDTPRYGISADGYTLRSGAPTSYLIRLENERRWRRLMIWQFSNNGTLFIRMNKIPYVVRECDLPV